MLLKWREDVKSRACKQLLSMRSQHPDLRCSSSPLSDRDSSGSSSLSLRTESNPTFELLENPRVKLADARRLRKSSSVIPAGIVPLPGDGSSTEGNAPCVAASNENTGSRLVAVLAKDARECIEKEKLEIARIEREIKRYADSIESRKRIT
jgi:hypothetical protein